ncbi:calcium ion antiporter [Aureococcus anophagefferens]|nr:calcium ion antiporter [Aureococcus anophagefferens]
MARAERDGAPSIWRENISLLFSHSMKLQREVSQRRDENVRLSRMLDVERDLKHSSVKAKRASFTAEATSGWAPAPRSPPTQEERSPAPSPAASPVLPAARAAPASLESSRMSAARRISFEQRAPTMSIDDSPDRLSNLPEPIPWEDSKRQQAWGTTRWTVPVSLAAATEVDDAADYDDGMEFYDDVERRLPKEAKPKAEGRWWWERLGLVSCVGFEGSCLDAAQSCYDPGRRRTAAIPTASPTAAKPSPARPRSASRDAARTCEAAGMGFPDIEASEIGNTGLLWLFVSYGYALFWASNQISEGSDLLLLVPSLAGIVGSCVLPVLGAVPDGAIMLFSGLGSVEEAQENLAVGIIQGPAFFLAGESAADVAAGERQWALAGLVVTLGGFVSYLVYQVRSTDAEASKQMKQESVIKSMMMKGEVSLATAGDADDSAAPGAYGTVGVADAAKAKIGDIVRPFFNRFDRDKNGKLDIQEVENVFRDLGEHPTPANISVLTSETEHTHALASAISSVNDDDDEEEEDEEEEIPDDIADLTPAQQQTVIKRRAFTTLAVGTAVVLIFSDPMVDVMSEIGARTGISPFYVSFVLAPSRRTRRSCSRRSTTRRRRRGTPSRSPSRPSRAPSMNNTFCLSIFMGLIYFKGIAWQYSAETIAIVFVQLAVGAVLTKKTLTMRDAAIVLSFYPASMLLVAGLEAMGLD